MKLTEVKNERTFNLEISESDLQELVSVVAYFPVAESEKYTETALDAIFGFTAVCETVGVRILSNRTKYIEDK